MSRYRNAFLRSVPAIVGLIMLIFFGSILSTSQYHTSLVKYGMPICRMDRHVFESDTCEACGADVMVAGVFYSTHVAMENPYSDDYQVEFTDYYESWEDFQADYDMCMTYSKVVVGVVVFEVLLYAFMLIKSKHEGKAPVRLQGRGSK